MRDGRSLSNKASFFGGALLPFLFWGEGSPTKIEYRKDGTLIVTSPLEDLEGLRFDIKQKSLHDP